MMRKTPISVAAPVAAALWAAWEFATLSFNASHSETAPAT
jgi:hypothetical protein